MSQDWKTKMEKDAKRLILQRSYRILRPNDLNHLANLGPIEQLSRTVLCKS